MVVLALGGITAVMGVLYALMQHDLKRLLAYHTVENIGIIFIGLGLALAFKAYGMALGGGARAHRRPAPRVQSFASSRACLFFGAGAVLTATGERDMEQLGGLIHRMPQTAFVFLVGCVAISALPPLNGFVSEWLTFQAILLSPQLPSWGLKFLVPAVGALLALSAALAAACFVKAFGVTFLGRAAHAGRRAARTRPIASRSPRCSSLRRSASSPASCPGFFIDALAPVVQGLVGDRMPVQTRRRMALDRADRREPQLLQRPPGLPVHGRCPARSPPSRSTGSPPTGCAARRPGTAAIPMRVRRPNTPPSSFAQPIRRVFGTVVFRAREHVEMPPPGDMRPARLTVDLRDLDLGRALRADRRRRRLRRRPAQSSAVPDHPPVPQPGLRRARAPAAGARDMAVILDLAVQGAQMLLVLLLAPLLTGFVRKVKARLLRRQGPPLIQPYRDLVRLMRKEVVLAENASWLFRVIPYLIFAATWVAASLVPTFRTGPDVLAGRPISSPSSRCSAARASSWRSPGSMSAPASAASARAAR